MKLNVRPSHIEAYQDSILEENATYIPSSDTLEGIMTESVVFQPIDSSMNDILNYVKEHSDSVKIVADMFKLDNVDCSLTESGTRMNIKIDDNTIANVPIESVINMQYSNILSSLTKKGGI